MGCNLFRIGEGMPIIYIISGWTDTQGCPNSSQSLGDTQMMGEGNDSYYYFEFYRIFYRILIKIVGHLKIITYKRLKYTRGVFPLPKYLPFLCSLWYMDRPRSFTKWWPKLGYWFFVNALSLMPFLVMDQNLSINDWYFIKWQIFHTGSEISNHNIWWI